MEFAMSDTQVPLSVVLAELLRIQRWAGGDSVSSARIFGLMHGVESVIRKEHESFGISEETQDKVEDLEDIESGKQSINDMAIKDRLDRDGVRETQAATVIELCRLQGRFTDAVEQLIGNPSATFGYLQRSVPPEHSWFGSLHYMELVDCTEGAKKKMHAVVAASVPRVGETITPQSGSTMHVVGVDYVIVNQSRQEGLSQHALVPHVLLEGLESGEART
jgi:hypothetical protein